MKTQTVAQRIAHLIEARANCAKTGNTEWYGKHGDALDALERELPSGSGIDCGTKIDREKTTATRIVLTAEFHHMNENGMYDGWTSHRITVTPTFHGIDVRVTGRNRNQINEYLGDVYYHALVAEVRS